MSGWEYVRRGKCPGGCPILSATDIVRIQRVCNEGRNPGRGSRARGSRGRSRDSFHDDDDEALSWIPPRPASDRYLPPPAGGLPPPAGRLPGQLWSQADRERWFYVCVTVTRESKSGHLWTSLCSITRRSYETSVGLVIEQWRMARRHWCLAADQCLPSANTLLLQRDNTVSATQWLNCSKVEL